MGSTGATPQWITNLLSWRSPRPPEEQQLPEKVWSRFVEDPTVQGVVNSGAVKTQDDLERLYVEFVDRTYGDGSTADE